VDTRQQEDNMLYEDVRTMAQRLNDLYNRHDLAGLAALHAPDFVIHSSTIPGGVADMEGWKAMMAMFWHAFPDMHNAIEDLVIEGDKVVLRLAYSGTHLGPFQGVPPTGAAFAGFPGIDISRYENGLVQEEWLEVNMLLMMQMLGVIPAAATA
jgi:steroid delta-isomerase-like uncharacterized protein